MVSPDCIKWWNRLEVYSLHPDRRRDVSFVAHAVAVAGCWLMDLAFCICGCLVCVLLLLAKDGSPHTLFRKGLLQHFNGWFFI